MSLESCIICSSANKKPLYEGIVKCSDCDHVYANLTLSDEEYKSLYNHDYFHGNEYSNYVSDKNVLQKNFLNRIKILNKFSSNKKNLSLLEIGSAYGFFLEQAKPFFKDVMGIDITESGVKYAVNKLKLNVKNIDFLKWKTDQNKWDIICLWDTIEHLKEPNLFIKKANSLMKKDGLIAITTGDINSWLSKIRGKNWRLIHPPTHIHYFSKKSLTDLLLRHGFEVIYFSYPGFYRSLDNIIYNIFVLRLKINWVYKLLKFLKLNKINIYSNTYDICYIIAKKIN